VEDSTAEGKTIIHLSGKGVSILQKVKDEIELQEKLYSVVDNMVSYLVGPKFTNITIFKEKARMMILMIKRDLTANGLAHSMRALAKKESLETFDIIYETL
jgi:hypothetical protein